MRTDNPIDGVYRVFVKQVPAGRFALGPCASNPGYSSMYVVFFAQATGDLKTAQAADVSQNGPIALGGARSSSSSSN